MLYSPEKWDYPRRENSLNIEPAPLTWFDFATSFVSAVLLVLGTVGCSIALAEMAMMIASAITGYPGGTH